VNHHPRVAEAHTVNVATFLLLLEDGALLDADADFELICGDMHAGLSHFFVSRARRALGTPHRP